MTELTHIVRRRTVGKHRGKRMVVSLQPGDVVGIRHERSRIEFSLSLACIYDLAAKLHARAVMAERQAARRKARS